MIQDSKKTEVPALGPGVDDGTSQDSFPGDMMKQPRILEPIGAGQVVTNFSGASLLLNFGRVNNS